MLRKFTLGFMVAALALAGGFAVQAQEAARAQIIKINTADFPTMHGLLDVYSADGKFVTGLDPMNLTVLENGTPLAVSNFAENSVGAQIVVAINPGQAMDIQNDLGISRYDQVVESLRIWAEARPLEPADEMSLISTTGPIIVNTTISEWRNSLVSFQPDSRSSIPSLQSLTFGLDLLEGQQASQEGMKRNILFLTPHLPDQTTVDALEQLTERALLLGVRVNVWMLDSDAYFAHFSANALKSMALQTGGSYFAFSGIETLPDPEEYFSHLRYVYSFDYQSQLSVGGAHLVAMQVQRSDLNLVSDGVNFTIDIQPPTPLLLSPPLQVVRQAPEDDPYNTDLLQPTETTLDYIIEFPDGHQRPLTRISLYVDDELVVEDTEAPFDQLVWDVSVFNTSGEHSLRIEVEDSLGLTQSSLGIPISVTVVQPPTGVLGFFGRYGSLLTIGVIVLTGLILGTILFFGGRRRLLASRREEKQASHDPLTQPLPTQKKRAKNARLPMPPLPQWSRRARQMQGRGVAKLARLNGNGLEHKGTPITLTGETLTLGADPVKAAFVLDDPSISPLHASLSRNEDGTFILKDEGSIAGTWINLEKVGKDGAALTHGDVVHLGAMRFQFVLDRAPQDVKPEIKVER